MKNAPTEFEVKFFPINLDEMRKKLTEVGAKVKTPERLMRRCVFAAFANPVHANDQLYAKHFNISLKEVYEKLANLTFEVT